MNEFDKHASDYMAQNGILRTTRIDECLEELNEGFAYLKGLAAYDFPRDVESPEFNLACAKLIETIQVLDDIRKRRQELGEYHAQREQ